MSLQCDRRLPTAMSLASTVHWPQQPGTRAFERETKQKNKMKGLESQLFTIFLWIKMKENTNPLLGLLYWKEEAGHVGNLGKKLKSCPNSWLSKNGGRKWDLSQAIWFSKCKIKCVCINIYIYIFITIYHTVCLTNTVCVRYTWYRYEHTCAHLFYTKASSKHPQRAGQFARCRRGTCCFGLRA